MENAVFKWESTNGILNDLTNLLTCQLCSRLVEKPNILGGCQHFFCKTCVDDYLIGEACPQCGLPSHARDSRVNRQLHTAVLLLKQLNTLVNPKRTKGNMEAKTKIRTLSPAKKVAKLDETSSNRRQNSLRTSVREEDSNCKDKAKNPVPRHNKHTTDVENMETNEDSSMCHVVTTTNQSSTTLTRRTRRPKTVDDKNEKVYTEKETENISGDLIRRRTNNSRSERKVKDSPIDSGTEKPTIPTKRKNSKSDHQLIQRPDEPVDDQQGPSKSGSNQPPSEPSGSGQNTRANSSDRSSSNSSRQRGRAKKSRVQSDRLQSPRSSSSHSTPKNKGRGGARSLSNGRANGRTTGMIDIQPWFSPSTSRSSFSSPGRSSINSPKVIKKNSKGETPLHVACIKGDEEAVKQLLKDGVEINVKDNAGWTPLHECVNHGHVHLAELLLDAGVLIDVPGLDNDTPLHDAVQNQQVACVRLLVRRGANTQLRNSCGKTPSDLATTKSVRDALNVKVEQDTSVNVSLSQSSYPAYNQAVILPTGLSRDQKNLLSKCAVLLHARIVQDFSPDVTHVVTGVNAQGQCARTIKYLQALLTGKWVLTLAWAQTCLEYGEQVSEEPFEVPGASSSPDSLAPNRARLNMQQQLPGLFDGCHFYFHGETSYPLPEKHELIALVKLGGASVLSREPKAESIDQSQLTVPYHVKPGSELEQCGNFIVNDGKGVRSEMIGSHLCWTKASWILNCIAHFELLNLE